MNMKKIGRKSIKWRRDEKKLDVIKEIEKGKVINYRQAKKLHHFYEKRKKQRK